MPAICRADDREQLDVMAGISEFPMRVKCATLAWHTFKNRAWRRAGGNERTATQPQAVDNRR